MKLNVFFTKTQNHAGKRATPVTPFPEEKELRHLLFQKTTTATTIQIRDFCFNK